VIPAPFAYLAPTTIDEALTLLRERGSDAKLLAGGHSLIPAMKLRLAQPACLIDLGRLQELRGIRLDANQLAIGALTTHADVASSPLVQEHLPGLADAARMIGDVQVRNRGTIGGSVAHADPAADFPVALTALDASFVLTSSAGRRVAAAEDFFVGFFTTALEPEEIVVEIRVPLLASHSSSAYQKLPNPASGYVEVSAAVYLSAGEDAACTDIRIAVGGLDGLPIRARAPEAALLGQRLTPEAMAAAAEHAAEGTSPDGDLYASAAYKQHMANVLTRDALKIAAGRLGL
jgi:carbon-monoxide dehydrogenase medium subunit